MPDEALEERLAAVERALDGADGTGVPQARSDLADRVADLEAQVAELEAAVQAVRGYVGNVRHVNEEVEGRADAAMAKAEAVERALQADRPVGTGTSVDRRADAATPDATPAHGPTDGTAAEGHGRADRCPRCGEPTAADRPTARHGTGDPTADRDDEESSGGGDAHPESSRARSRPPGDGRSRVGHRQLEPAEDPGDRGLLARLRGVL